MLFMLPFASCFQLILAHSSVAVIVCKLFVPIGVLACEVLSFFSWELYLSKGGDQLVCASRKL